jgi:hypothetical protein
LIWSCLKAYEVQATKPAFYAIPRKLINSIIMNQFPISAAPDGNGLWEKYISFNLSTCTSVTLLRNAKKKLSGKARPKRLRKLY